RCLFPLTRLKITPITWVSLSKVLNPLTSAPALREVAEASTTRITGQRSTFDRCAELPSSLLPSQPSNNPITPSTRLTSAPAEAVWNEYGTHPGNIQVSRFLDLRSVT